MDTQTHPIMPEAEVVRTIKDKQDGVMEMLIEFVLP